MAVSRREFVRAGAVAGVAGIGALTAQQSGSAHGGSTSNTGCLTSTYKSRFGHDIWSDAVHAAEDSDCSSYPIYQGTTNHGLYTRDSNPTIDSVEVKLKHLEGAEAAVATACGMAAISQALLAFLRPDCRLVLHRTVYGNTQMLIEGPLKSLGIEFERINMTDLNALREALKKKTDVVYFEVHSNPTLDVVDVREASALAHEAGAMVIVDNTFLSPYLIQPLALGADIVLQSCTKYLMGHGNGLGGIVCGCAQLMKQVKYTRLCHGGIMTPMNAFLLHQGIMTLPMRMERHCANAMRVAQFLETHPKVKKVHYPGLASDPGHHVARKQVNGFGGMLGFERKSGSSPSSHVKLCRNWTSLGEVKTLMADYGYLAEWGVPANYTRMSIGIEDPDDIIEDLKQAFDKV